MRNSNPSKILLASFYKVMLLLRILEKSGILKMNLAMMNLYGWKWSIWGWSGILIPEEYGGFDFGMVGMGSILEEAGKTLTPSPFVLYWCIGCKSAYAWWQ
jgi:hypothetical protein